MGTPYFVKRKCSKGCIPPFNKPIPILLRAVRSNARNLELRCQSKKKCVSSSPANQLLPSANDVALSRNHTDSRLDIASLARNGRIIWRVIAAMSVATIVAYRAAGLSFAWLSNINILLCVLIFLSVSCCYRWLRPDPWVSFGTEACVQLTLVLSLGSALSYPLAAAGFPYSDALLDAADKWMQLDWRTYLQFINDNPTLAVLTWLAYGSMLLQFTVLALVLVAASRIVRLQQYVLASGLALCLTLAVFTFMPAGGTYSFLQIQPGDFANLSPITTYNQKLVLDALRTGQQTLVGQMEGLITFPSFHAVWAILFAWGFYPIKQLRFGAIMLNLFVIASTPIQGAHYFIDIVGGGAVAAIAIYAATRLTRAATDDAMERARQNADVRRDVVAGHFAIDAALKAVPDVSGCAACAHELRISK
jgi:membrane-associated phospholipid phosphatase